ncbi:Putative cystathionine gamma-synthase YML082W [Seminavis robusta]|uniref:Cystathionine gamma-synthase YML082W n=1 Tax=Seminavis robusta TaxID=568900 RepID=A0A9N8DZC7_9STRA|nr:Putative cystathionine gamma-synthase YML082W [Seminavis robusta]|eukprot:Sro388_g132280.1 Putative cystathionine gamma-synthase YML082W (660) ;mRNA; f:17342-19321
MSAIQNDSTPEDASLQDTSDNDEEILLEPRTSEPLGLPIPRDEHACSVSLPSWSSVVGYEEGDASITAALRCGYPRFMYHPVILQLASHVVKEHSPNETEDCLLLPSHAAAVRCQAFLQEALEGQCDKDNALLCTTMDPSDATTGDATTWSDDNPQAVSRIRIVAVGGNANIHAVLFPAETPAAMQAKAYWQHTGEIVSSRRAEAALTNLNIPVERTVTCGPKAPYIWHPADSTSNDNDDTSLPFTLLRQRIAEWTNLQSEESVFLTPSGMASIYTCLRSARRYQMLHSNENSRSDGGRSIVYGFPYLDTLKLASRKEFCPAGVDFFGFGNDNDLQLLEQVLEQNNNNNHQYCALFTEVPSNPLLQCPDLYALRQLADQYGFALIVDDTIGNFLNLDMIHTGIADAVCTSLTKIVSGRGDAMAGSIVTNPNTAKGRWMQQDLQQDGGSSLFVADANAILANSQDFRDRNLIINESSETLADWFRDHPDVETVYYPKYAPLYPSLIAESPNPRYSGYGGLMSILLESHMCQRTFYDELNVAKGPSLGTNFTLVCPYTLLAHYHELDFAMNYNVPPNLLRISVGLEDPSELKNKFEDAFARSRLYPKLSSPSSKTSGQQVRSYSTMTDLGQVGGATMNRYGLRNSYSTIMTMKSLLRRVPR